MKRVLGSSVLVLLLMFPEALMAAGAGNQPRDWIAAPQGTVAGLLYYNLTSGKDIYTDGSKTADAELDASSGMFRAVSYFGIGDYTADVNILIPFGNMELSAGGAETTASGVGDPGIVGTFWLVDDPAEKRYVAVAQYLFVPIGEYQNAGALTLGNNRWQGKTAVNFTQGFEAFPNHDIYIEAGLGVDYYGENDDYGVNSDNMSQDPVYTVDSHISYDLTSDWWVALDYCGVWGGAKSWADLNDKEEQNTQSVGASASLMLTPSTNVLLQYSKDVYIENGVRSDNLLMRFTHAINVNSLFE